MSQENAEIVRACGEAINRGTLTPGSSTAPQTASWTFRGRSVPCVALTGWISFDRPLRSSTSPWESYRAELNLRRDRARPFGSQRPNGVADESTGLGCGQPAGEPPHTAAVDDDAQQLRRARGVNIRADRAILDSALDHRPNSKAPAPRDPLYLRSQAGVELPPSRPRPRKSRRRARCATRRSR